MTETMNLSPELDDDFDREEEFVFHPPTMQYRHYSTLTLEEIGELA